MFFQWRNHVTNKLLWSDLDLIIGARFHIGYYVIASNYKCEDAFRYVILGSPNLSTKSVYIAE